MANHKNKALLEPDLSYVPINKEKLPACNQLAYVGIVNHITNSNVGNNNFVAEQTETDKRPCIYVKIFGTMVRALLDSGAKRTIMSLELYKRIHLQTNRDIDISGMEIALADGKTINTIEEIMFNLEV